MKRTYPFVGKSKTYKKARIASGAPSAAMVAARQRRVAARALASMGLKPELKFFDTSLAFSFDSTGEVPATGQLALIPQGDTESSREGRLAVIKSVQIRANMSFAPGAAATASVNCFLYLVLDTQANGAAAGVTDVFTSTSLQSAMLNLNNSGRFRIIKYWKLNFTSQAGATTAYNTVNKHIDFYKRCNIKMDWSSTTGAITEIRSNNLFLIAGSDTGADDLVGVSGVCRLRFVG